MKMEFGNTNSKEIFNNKVLCAQFLRGYTGIPLFSAVQPDDITDVTEKLRPYIGVEFEGDTVKQIHMPDKEDMYVIALMEHKSTVDYDVTFQLLKYMVGIWTNYRNEKNKEQPGSSSRKDFKYPLIVPIVYYEGAANWTAAMHWQERVEYAEMFGEYMPDFTYKVINLHEYSRRDLLSKEDEISLVMMFNRIQTAEDLDITKWQAEEREAAQRILRKAPDAVLQILSQMVHHFGLKLHMPDDELTRCLKNVEERDMGELWANMEKMDIQEERRNTAEARRLLTEAQNERDRAQNERDDAQNELVETQNERDAALQQNKELTAEVERLRKMLQDKK